MVVKLKFRQFVEEDIGSWLLNRADRNYQSIIPPVSATPEQLLQDLDHAEAKGDFKAVLKAKQAIESHGYTIKTLRTLAPKVRRRIAAK